MVNQPATDFPVPSDLEGFWVLKDGLMITVDGSKGIVRIESS